MEPAGQATLIASERFEERGEPQLRRKALQKFDVAGGFADHNAFAYSP